MDIGYRPKEDAMKVFPQIPIDLPSILLSTKYKFYYITYFKLFFLGLEAKNSRLLYSCNH